MSVQTQFAPIFTQVSDGHAGRPIYVWSLTGSASGDASGGILSAIGFESRPNFYKKLVLNVEGWSGYTNTGTVAATVRFDIYRPNVSLVFQWFTALVASPGGTYGGWKPNEMVSMRDCIIVPGINNNTGIILLTLTIPNANGGTLDINAHGYAWLREEYEHGRELRRLIR